MTPAMLRQLAAHNRAIADAAWSAYYAYAQLLSPTDSERQLAIANSATLLAHDLERKALTLEGDRNVSTDDVS